MLSCSTNLAPLHASDKENATHIVVDRTAVPVAGSSSAQGTAAQVQPGSQDRKRRRIEDHHLRRPKRPGMTYLDRERENERRRREVVSPAGTERVAISTPGAKVIFPRKLARPDRKAVSGAALVAVDPSLADVAPAYVQDKLLPLGPALMAVLARTRAAPASGLPQDIDVILPASEAESRTQFPTHMLAVHAKQPKVHTDPQTGVAQLKRKVTLFPVHDLVLVAHCANLPTLPPSGTQLLSNTQEQQEPTQQLDAGDSASSSPLSLKLPVVPLCLPSPPTFPILQSYLYTKRVNELLARLLPEVPGTTATAPGERPAITTDRNETMRNLVESLSDAYEPSALLTHVLRAHGLWSNICVLGVHDDKLWRVLDIAWEALLTAMDLATRKHPEHSLYGAALTPGRPDADTSASAAAHESLPTSAASPSPVPEAEPTTPTSTSSDPLSDDRMSTASSQTSPSSAAASDRADCASDMDTAVSSECDDTDLVTDSLSTPIPMQTC